MTMIPMLLARLSPRAAPTLVAGPGRYDPGAGHRPLAAIVAVGLPIALLVGVALSPFELPPKFASKPFGAVNLPWQEPPPPPPEPSAEPQLPPISRVAVPPLPLPPVSQNHFETVDIADPPPIDIGPVIGTAPPIAPATPPPLPFVEAKPDPRFAASFQPDYPPYEQRMEIEGTARVRVLVGTDGRVKAVEELASTSPGFFTETRRRALAKWRFKPALRGDRAEESWVTMTVRFRLEK